MNTKEMKTIREMRTLAEKVFINKLKVENITFKNSEEKEWFKYALNGLKSDTHQ